MKYRVFWLIFALSCTSKPSGVRSIALVRPTGCQPSDGVDDRVCLQAVLDAACATGGGTVHLESGTWEVTRPAPIPGNRDNASLWMECSDLALEGEGPSTTLMMKGDGYASDWSGLRIAYPAQHIEISDITIASNAAFNINEQTHLLMLGSTVNTPGPISNVSIHHVRFRHPVRDEVAGDCLRFVGESATPITFVDVGSVVFESCDRSGVAVQRGVQHVKLHDLMFLDIGKTDIDMEPSGDGEIAYFDMRGLDIGDISIAGQNAQYAHDIVLTSSHVRGRLGVIYARNVTIGDNVIAETANASEGTINIRGSSDVVISNNIIRRLAGSFAGPAVRVSGVSGKFPDRLTFVGNNITNDIAGPVIDAESVQDMLLSGNTITGSDATSFGVKINATGRDVGGLLVSGNRFRGPLLYAVRLSGTPANVAGATVSGNYSSGVTGAGLRCENPLKFTKPIVHNAYMYDGATSATSGCTGVSIISQSP